MKKFTKSTPTPTPTPTKGELEKDFITDIEYILLISGKEMKFIIDLMMRYKNKWIINTEDPKLYVEIPLNTFEEPNDKVKFLAKKSKKILDSDISCNFSANYASFYITLTKGYRVTVGFVGSNLSKEINLFVEYNVTDEEISVLKNIYTGDSVQKKVHKPRRIIKWMMSAL